MRIAGEVGTGGGTTWIRDLDGGSFGVGQLRCGIVVGAIEGVGSTGTQV